MVTLGPLLKRYRQRRGFSQRGLSKASGVRQSLISELETGKKKDTQSAIVQRLARALGVATAVLLGEESPNDHHAYPPHQLPWTSLCV